MIDRILRTGRKPKGCILCLPGRYGKGRHMAEAYRGAGLGRTLIVGMTPGNGWYPPPHGADDQADSVAGLPAAVEMLDGVLRRIRRSMGICREEVVLAGFSAGASVALECLNVTRYPFAAVVCHAGFALEPDKILRRRHDTPIILAHCKDDRIVKWDQRYAPTKASLEAAGYEVAAIERTSGGHALFKDDLVRVANFIAPLIGYHSDWRHPMTDLIQPAT
jgi:predicted esterase